MTSKIADSIRRGLEEAVAFAEGTADASRFGVHIPQEIDVKAIRGKLGMTQVLTVLSEPVSERLSLLCREITGIGSLTDSTIPL